MLSLSLPKWDSAHRELALNALANTLACALDETLIRRVGGFQWQNAQVHGAPPPLQSVPSNRYDRSALHLWHTVCEPDEVDMPSEEAQALADLLDDCMKVASRLHGGQLWPMMQESVWRMLRDQLQQDLAMARGAS